MPGNDRRPFVPEHLEVPRELSARGFHLVPLGPEHNEADHAAWSSSIDHIRATPGFTGRDWPRPMSLEQNRDDLERHAADFAARSGFTYSVLDDAGTVIGCVYIYPPQSAEPDGADADVRSWVSAAHADLDADLYRVVRDWLADTWPFATVRYASRTDVD
jgi:hypothetical protein